MKIKELFTPLYEQRPYMGGISSSASYYDENEEDEYGRPALQYDNLHPGTTLYHGTSSEDFNEIEEDLNPPTWFSESPRAASWFASGYQGGEKARLLTFKVTQPYRLLLIQDRQAIEDLGEYYGIDIDDTREMAEQVCGQLGVDGWIIPNNYPEQGGSDILLCDLSGVEYISTGPVAG